MICEKEADKESLIEIIIEKEYFMFDKVRNIGGRADCQDQKTTFYRMRRAQFDSWDLETCKSYHEDLVQAMETGRNLLSEKYGYMMEDTHPQEYEKIKSMLPTVTPEKQTLIQEILAVYVRQTESFMLNYPAFAKRSRPVHKNDIPGVTSIETYMEGELKTYSATTLRHLLLWMRQEEREGRCVVYELYRDMVRDAGYKSLNEVC